MSDSDVPPPYIEDKTEDPTDTKTDVTDDSDEGNFSRQFFFPAKNSCSA